MEPLARFISRIDKTLPLNFLAFRPNFVMENYRGAKKEEMQEAVKKAEKAGLQNVSWSGRTDIPGKADLKKGDRSGAETAREIAEESGCIRRSRNCASCENVLSCPIKNHRAQRRC